ncbi:hypothetical protein BDP27DRAFT_1419180 [Rhodocollybia butyracea]|uniref:BHLH domain-containing protein n=1 Tax=Rhodocollybia butyracea TaxID=206335 RepID=A0A9P5U9W6_9AGAR|nr:hypothetical protein BDP27DRAFT_1419180 [Rhodocollybia butyracea]
MDYSSFVAPPSFSSNSSVDYLQDPTNAPSLHHYSSSAFNTLGSPMTSHSGPRSTFSDYGYAPVAPPLSGRYTPLENASVPPPTLAYGFGNTNAVSDGRHSGRRGLGSNPSSSFPSAPYATTAAHRNRQNSINVSTTRPSTPRSPNSNTSNYDWDEAEEEHARIIQAAVRRERIVSDQKRRDDLRSGFKRLRSTLPPTNQKLSQAKLLDFAAEHISQLEAELETVNKLNTTSARHISQLEAELEAANNELNIYRPYYDQ